MLVHLNGETVLICELGAVPRAPSSTGREVEHQVGPPVLRSLVNGVTVYHIGPNPPPNANELRTILDRSELNLEALTPTTADPASRETLVTDHHRTYETLPTFRPNLPLQPGRTLSGLPSFAPSTRDHLPPRHVATTGEYTVPATLAKEHIVTVVDVSQAKRSVRLLPEGGVEPGEYHSLVYSEDWFLCSAFIGVDGGYDIQMTQLESLEGALWRLRNFEGYFTATFHPAGDGRSGIDILAKPYSFHLRPSTASKAGPTWSQSRALAHTRKAIESCRSAVKEAANRFAQSVREDTKISSAQLQQLAA